MNIHQVLTIAVGFGREVEPENEGIDPGLAELNAQKNQVTRARYIRMGTASGLTRAETLLSAPGEAGDLWELYLRARGVKREGSGKLMCKRLLQNFGTVDPPLFCQGRHPGGDRHISVEDKEAEENRIISLCATEQAGAVPLLESSPPFRA